MFGFSRANHASTNLKKFSSSKLDKFTLFTHSFVGWNMENRYKEGESIFLRLSWHFKRQKSVFCKASFCKTRADYACKKGKNGKNFSFNHCHTKGFAFCSRESYSRHWENSRQLCKPSTSSGVCIAVSNSANPSRVYIRLCKQGKRFLLLKVIP